jgi:hypothetical protein
MSWLGYRWAPVKRVRFRARAPATAPCAQKRATNTTPQHPNFSATDNITIDDAFSKVFWPKISFAKGSETEPDENWVRVCEFYVRLQNCRPLSY